MSDAIIGALIGVSGTAVLALVAGGIRGLFSAGGHKERLDDHEQRLDDHQAKLDKLPTDFVPRTELTARLDALGATAKSTEDWVRFLVKKEAVPPQDS